MDSGMKQQPEEERGAEEEADILVAPISLLLVDAEMVLTANFQNSQASPCECARPLAKPFAAQQHHSP